MANQLLNKIRACQICKNHLPYKPNPILQFKKSAKILLVGQAPGVLAHQSCKPWNDKSGQRLREWLNISEEKFYDPALIAIVPMGFCYPGKGKSGDLPPRKECAEEWMAPIRQYLSNIEFEIYVGQYACRYEFGKYTSLTDLIKNQIQLKQNKIALPHPSPRNNIWLAKNPWFENETLPFLRRQCQKYF